MSDLSINVHDDLPRRNVKCHPELKVSDTPSTFKVKVVKITTITYGVLITDQLCSSAQFI